jgi:NADPH:quinone reductase-like Zn-dependent oxidoreductase
MRAVQFDRFGPPEVLYTARRPVPVPAADEVLVRVAAVGVGRFLDVQARAGRHPYPGFESPHVLGAEHAGVVVALGTDVTDVAIGARVAVFPAVVDRSCRACVLGRTEQCETLRVIGIHRQGADAEYVAVPAGNVRVVPAGLDPAQAASVALCGAVAANQLRQAGLRTGDRVLVQGGASALGAITAALAKHLGAEVITASRSPAKRAALAGLGFVALDAAASDFVDQVRDRTDGRGADLVVDNLGIPEVWASTMASLALGGSVVCSGAFLGGPVSLNLAQLYSRSQRVIGVRTGSVASFDEVWREVERGFRPVLDRAFPASSAAEAHRYLDSDGNVGRVVLLTGPSDW